MYGAISVGTSRCIRAMLGRCAPAAKAESTSRMTARARIDDAVYAAEARRQPSCKKGTISCSTAHCTLCAAMLTSTSAIGSTSCSECGSSDGALAMPRVRMKSGSRSWNMRCLLLAASAQPGNRMCCSCASRCSVERRSSVGCIGVP